MVVDAQSEFEWDSQFAALRSCGEVALYFDLNKDGTGYVHNGGGISKMLYLIMVQ